MNIKPIPKRYKKQVLGILGVLALIAWFSRVVYINKKYSENIVYLNMGTQIDFGDYSMTPTEAKLLSAYEFENLFGVGRDEAYDLGIFENDRMICLRFHIKNTSDHKLEWEDVLYAYGEGFETTTWGSACNPVLRNMINTLNSDSFDPGCEIDYWLVTSVARVAFKDGTWNDMAVKDFLFTLSLYPNSVKIRLQ